MLASVPASMLNQNPADSGIPRFGQISSRSSSRGVPVEDPIGWATGKEFWIRNTVWRDTIFEGNADDSMAAADALIDHGLLRAKRRERDLEVRERTITVRVREQTFRAFAVSKSILSWKDPTPARFEEILAAASSGSIHSKG